MTIGKFYCDKCKNNNGTHKDECPALLRNKAFTALREAEKKMHEYACSLDIGDERTQAFEVFENVRNAARV